MTRPALTTVIVYVADGNGGLGHANLEVTVNPIAPAFDSLAGASITYGQGDVTLGGHIGGAALIPSGSVDHLPRRRHPDGRRSTRRPAISRRSSPRRRSA